MRNLKQLLLRVLVVGIVGAVIYAGTLPWREERLVNKISAGEVGLETREAVPFADKPGRQLARMWLNTGKGSSDDALYHIRQSIKQRSLYAPSWLDLAEINIRLNRLEEAGEYIDTATRLWPNRRILLWRAAMLWIQIGREDKILSTLKRYVRSRPSHIKRAAVVAARFVSDSEKLITDLIPEEPPYNQEPGYYMEQMLSYAMSQNNQSLATTAWYKLTGEASIGNKLIAKYIDFLIRHRDMVGAISVFNHINPMYQEGNVFNNSFENDILGFGFGWIIRDFNGGSWQIDEDISSEGKHSLRINFDGTENIVFRHLYQRVPVESGMRYRLKGMWKGKDISTRSNPYFELFSNGAEQNTRAKIDVNSHSWDWQPFEAELLVPYDAALITLRLRRDRTDALDNKLFGAIWLDDFSLVKVQN